MKLSELLAGVDVLSLHVDPALEITDISYDSRNTKPGGLFVAIRGFESDGHRFIEAAQKNGAVCVVCEEAPVGRDALGAPSTGAAPTRPEPMPYVLVENSRLTLALLSKNYFGDPAGSMTLIGVTGTSGKTTGTMLLKHMLEVCVSGKVGLVGTNQNMIQSTVLPAERTTPESYELQKLFRQMKDAGCTHVVMEVSSHSLVLDRVAGLTFDVAAFTNLSQDHLDFHRTMEDYASAKAMLFWQARRGAVNLDSAYAPLMLGAPGCEYLTYALNKNEAELLGKDPRFCAGGVRFCALYNGELQRTGLPIPGRFSVYNALTVIACGLLLGLPLRDVCASLESAEGVKGRMELVPVGADYSIVIDYAHKPDALENALKTLKEVATGRLVVLFGCGGDRDRGKRPLMGAIAAKLADFVIVTSDNPRTEEPSAIISQIVAGLKGTHTPHKVIEDREEAIRWAMDHHQAGDILLLAGKGHETYQIVGKTKRHMDEREIVAEHLKSQGTD
ncbi:MAG: UDP-N-acetylmuramoyl-L-alanyl-D-glutamate--2,6-diaminopimelate ligase [Firmicutes bacterium]|nr:UDP-N-acetylmuramoyl-L-alanyl-D-glutamate--2,6-diaminopimelate ligase [Bacillota bacterium]